MKIKKRIALVFMVVLASVCGLVAVSACGKKDACADGHSYGNPVWSWTQTADGFAAEAKFTCAENGEHTETQTATVTNSKTESTCKLAGKIVYTASVTFDGKNYSDTKQVDLQLAEHDYSTVWSKNGQNHWHECTVCGDKADIAAHKAGAAATETTAQICNECGYELAPALGHTHVYANPVWSWTQTAEGYTAEVTFTCSGNSEHTKTETATVTNATTDSTCTVAGKIVYAAAVTFEGANYSDTKQVNLQLASHDYSTVWSQNGQNHWHECTVCGNKTDDAAHKPGAAATETTAQTCTDCGYELAPALGHTHTYANAQWTWNEVTGGYSVTLEVTCSGNSEHTKTETATVTNVTTASTCKVAGKIVYTASVTIGEQSFTDNKTVNLELLSHTPAAVVRENELPATCTAKGHYDEVVYCSACDDELSRTSKSIAKIAHDNETETVAATCATRGSITYTCKVCHKVETEILNPLGHLWDKTEVTCTEGRACTRQGCDASEAAHGHDYQVNSAVEVSCTVDGTVTYKCGYCQDEYTSVTATARGHLAGEWTYTDETAGNEPCQYVQHYEAICQRDGCGETLTDSHTVTRHSYTSAVTALANCTEEGTRTYTCSNPECGDHYDEAIAVIESAHEWNDGTEQGNTITYVCLHNDEHERVVISAKEEESATIDDEALETLKEVGEIQLKNASIAMDDTLKEQLNDGVSIGAQTCTADDIRDELNISDETAQRIGDNEVYNLTIMEGDQAVDFNGGKATVRIPYTLEEGDDPEDIAIWYINGDTPQLIKATYVNGYAVFETEHFSYYTVTRLTPAERCAIYDHNYRTTVKEPTCVSEGYTLNVCQRCGDREISEYRDALGHDFHEDRTAATCTQSGLVTYTCNRCDYSYNEKLEALGHSWIEADRQEASCTASGYIAYVCEHDDTHTYKTTIAQKQHSYTAEVTAPTCTEAGYTTYTCVDCDYSYQGAPRPATGHKYEITVIAPTCTTDGYTRHDCENCDESYISDEVKGGHVWNIDTPTCGEGQKCTVCGEEGLPATGNHNMVNGVCEVCGAGCEHEFDEENIAPTCTDRGYTLSTCQICGLRQKSDYVPAKGHSGKTQCVVCGEKLIPDGFFTDMLKELLKSEFTIVLNDVQFTYNDRDTHLSYELGFGELFIGTDAYNQLYAYGNGTITMTDDYMPIPVSAGVAAIIEDGMLYARVDYFGESVGGVNNGERFFSNEDHAMYIRLPIESFTQLFGSDVGGFEATLASLPEIIALVKTQIIPMLDNLITANEQKVSGYLLSIAEKFFDINKTSTGYTLTLDKAGFAEYFKGLGEFTVSQNFDILFGEGAFEMLVEKIALFTDKTVGELLDGLTAAGLDVNAVINVLNVIAVKMDKEDFSDLVGLDIELEVLITSQKFRSMTVIELINKIKNGGDTSEGDDGHVIPEEGNGDNPAYPDDGEEQDEVIDAAYIKDLLYSYGDMKLYEILAHVIGCEVEEVEMVADIVANVLSTATGAITTDANGKIILAVMNFGADVEIEELDVTVSGVLGLTTTHVSEYDYTAIPEQVEKTVGGFELTEDNIDWAGADAQVEYYDDGTVKSVSVTYVNEQDLSLEEIGQLIKGDSGFKFDIDYLQYRISEMMNELRYKGHYDDYEIKIHITETSNFKVLFFKNTYIIYETDCGDWAIVGIGGDMQSTDNCEVKITAVSLADGGLLLPENIISMGGPSYGGNACRFFYNKISGKVELLPESSSDEEQTKHEFIEETEKHVPAQGCTGYGQRYYVCRHCGKSYIIYYTNGHGKLIPEYEFADPANPDCEDGVKVNYVCTVCGEIAYYSYYSWHVTENTEVLDLSEYDVCSYHRLEYRECPCGKQSYFEYDLRDGSNMQCHNCMLRITRETQSTKENCVRTTVTNYSVYVGDQFIKSYTTHSSSDDHEYINYVYLNDGATSCEQGAYMKHVCADCGYMEEGEWNYFEHQIGVREGNVIDLKEHGADGGYVLLTSCACGEVVSDVNLTGKWDIDQGYDSDNDLSWVTFTSLSDGYVVRLETVSQINGCLITDKVTIRCGYDRDTNTEIYKQEYFKQEYLHKFEIVNIELLPGSVTCNDGTLITQKCHDCGITRTEEGAGCEVFAKTDMDLSEFGAVCGEHFKLYSCACGRVTDDWRNNIEGEHPLIYSDSYLDYYSEYVYYNSEYDFLRVYKCAVTDPVTCNLTYAIKAQPRDDGYAYYYILIGCNDSGENAGYEQLVRKTEMHNYVERAEQIDGCLYQITTYCTIHPNRENEKHVYTDYRHSWKTVEEQPTCSQYGVRYRHCTVCGEIAQKELIEPRHQWYEQGDIHVCSVCGLENANGADGDVVLEECLDLSDDDLIVVGYFVNSRVYKDNGHDYNEVFGQNYEDFFVVNITLILSEPVGGDDQILVEIDDLVNRWQNENRLNGSYVAFSRNKVEEWATKWAQGNGYKGTYEIRISFVPVGGLNLDYDLDYAITFGSLEEANARKLERAKEQAINTFANLVYGTYHDKFGYELESIVRPAFEEAQSIEEVNELVAQYQAQLFEVIKGEDSSLTHIANVFIREWKDILRYYDPTSVSEAEYNRLLEELESAESLEAINEIIEGFNNLCQDVRSGESSPEKQFARLKDQLLDEMQNRWQMSADNGAFVNEKQDEYDRLYDNVLNAQTSQSLEVYRQQFDRLCESLRYCEHLNGESVISLNDYEHRYYCADCGYTFRPEWHTFITIDGGTGCEVCDYRHIHEARENPEYAGDSVDQAYWFTDYYRHYRECMICGSHYDDSEHEGDTYMPYFDAPDKCHQRVCDICGFGYGDVSDHTFWEDRAQYCNLCGAENQDYCAHTNAQLDEYSWSEYYHFLDCPDCHQRVEVAHSWITEDGQVKCEVCGAVCNHNSAEVYDSKTHVCNICHNTVNHNFDSESRCIACGYVCEHGDKGSVCVCPDCGYATHQSDSYLNDENDHWKVCGECEAEFERGAHVYNEDGLCGVCGYVNETIRDCEHEFMLGGQEAHNCAKCSLSISHNFEDGKCTVCDYICEHYNYNEGQCFYCGKVCEHGSYIPNEVEGHRCDVCQMLFQHEFNDGMCVDCGYQCNMHSYVDGVCDICGKVCLHNSWNWIGDEHQCDECKISEPHDWENGTCKKCQYTCNHYGLIDENGVCGKCGGICEHMWNDGGERHFCSNCYLQQDHNYVDGMCTVCNHPENEISGEGDDVSAAG